MKTVTTFFNTRKVAREFAISNKLKTTNVNDGGATKAIGDRWSVSIVVISKQPRKLKIVKNSKYTLEENARLKELRILNKQSLNNTDWLKIKLEIMTIQKKI